MKSFLLYFLLLWCSLLHSQTIKNINELVILDSVYTIDNEKVLSEKQYDQHLYDIDFHGVSFIIQNNKYYPENELELYTGIGVIYRKNGTTKKELYFENGVFKKLKSFRKNGSVSKLQIFNSDGRDSITTFYNTKKNHKFIIHYDSRGYMTKTYSYDNDILTRSADYTESSLDGYLKIYTEKGLLSYSCKYKNGKKNGKEICYDENGTITYSCEYKNGKKHGKKFCVDENGNLAYECDFIDNKKHGIEKKYRNGKLKETQYIHGKKVK